MHVLSRPTLPPAGRSRRRLVALAVIVLVIVGVARFNPPNYALDPVYTDHLQHEYSAWAFLHIGTRIFDTPKNEWGYVSAKHVHLLWEQLPTIYPPGLVALFLPAGVASNEGLLPDERVHMLMVMVLGIGGVVASVQLVRTLRLSYDPALAAILAFLGTLLLVTYGLNGFVDSTAAGLALAGIYHARRGPPGRALVVFVLGLSLQYRLWYLWPLVVAHGYRHRREIARGQLAVAGLVGALSAATFGLSVPFVAKFRHIPEITPNALAVTHGVNLDQGAALVAAAIVLAITLRFEGAVVAACLTLALVLLFCVDQWEAWYPVLFVPLLAIVRARPAQVAVTLAFVETLIYLGGFPNLLRDVHLYVDAVK